MRRSTRWTSGRALCRTLRRWFPFFPLFLPLSLSPFFFFFLFFSPILSFLGHSSPPPPPFSSVITATLYRLSPSTVLSLGTGLSFARCRSSGPTWRTRRHFTRRENLSFSTKDSNFLSNRTREIVERIGKFDKRTWRGGK